MEKSPAARETIGRWTELKTERSRYEPDWEDISWLIRGMGGGFGSDDHALHHRRKALSSEPILAQQSMKAGIYSALTNPANPWGGLETPDSELNNWRPMAEWIDVSTRRVLNSFRPEVSSFYSASLQTYGDLAGFGNAVGYDELDEDSRQFIDVAMNLAECVFTIDAHGRVNELVRRYKLTARAAMRRFKKDAKHLPSKLHELAEKGSSEKLTFYWHVLPNDSFEKGRLGVRGKPWLSRHVCDIQETLVRSKGFDENPCYTPRWDVNSGESYGIGPGHIALPGARLLHQMEASSLRVKQNAADPTLLAPDRDAWPLNGRVRPGAVVYGGLNIRGQQMLQPLNNFQAVQLTDAERRAKVEEIAKAFHYALMPLAGRTGLNPEETRIIEEAHLRNWAPNADRIMEEYAARKFTRRFRLLWRAGQLPPPPDGIPEGTPLNVRYQSAATMAQLSRNGMAVRSFLQDTAALAQANPAWAARIGARVNPDALLEALHEASPTLPAKILRDREEADAAAQQEAEAQNAMQQMQMLQAGGGIAKDFAQAGKAAADAGMEAPQ